MSNILLQYPITNELEKYCTDDKKIILHKLHAVKTTLLEMKPQEFNQINELNVYPNDAVSFCNTLIKELANVYKKAQAEIISSSK